MQGKSKTMNQTLVNTIREYFTTKPVSKAWIFGSFARGEEREDSDVDILVVIKQGEKFSLFDHSKWIYELEDLLSRTVDLVKDGTLLPFAQETADKDKILIYEGAS